MDETVDIIEEPDILYIINSKKHMPTGTSQDRYDNRGEDFQHNVSKLFYATIQKLLDNSYLSNCAIQDFQQDLDLTKEENYSRFVKDVCIPS